MASSILKVYVRKQIPVSIGRQEFFRKCAVKCKAFPSLCVERIQKVYMRRRAIMGLPLRRSCTWRHGGLARLPALGVFLQ